MVRSFIAVGTGAAIGAWMRWGLSVWLNPSPSPIPLGTLAANLVGGYVIGIALGWITYRPGVSPEWRLFLVTGLLGGLTTFSTFSAEIVQHMLCGGRAGSAGAIRARGRDGYAGFCDQGARGLVLRHAHGNGV